MFDFFTGSEWTAVCNHYAPAAGKATERMAYIRVLERSIGELYDSHAHLAVNTPSSPRLVPSQADLMAQWVDERAIITDVRDGSAPQIAGIRAGDEILSIGNATAGEAADEFSPRFLRNPDASARDWALQVALAGRRDKAVVRLKLKTNSSIRQVEYAGPAQKTTARLSSNMIDRIGYLRINNSLGDQSLVDDFDAAIGQMAEAQALIIDLRDTPSGGNTSVARGILSRLIGSVVPYQRHEHVGEYRSTGIRRIWTEYVAPRGVEFSKPIVVLVGRWTGSMGEGLAIGLNATRSAPVLGRPMARLLGALGEFSLPQSRIVVRVPVEKLFHVDGTPREAYLPRSVAKGVSPGQADAELIAALELARTLVRTEPTQPGVAPHASSPLNADFGPHGRTGHK